MKNKYELFYKMMLRACDNMNNLLEKAEGYLAESGVGEEEILSARLAPDMYDFKRQVQIFSDNAKGGVARLAGVDAPKFEDSEKTILELKERIKKTKEFLQSMDIEKVEDIENRRISMGWMPSGMYFEGPEYLENFIFQNSLFHLSTAYNILRNKGVKIGKMDFIGKMEMKQG